MGHAHESLAAPFADLHVEDGVVKVTLLHDPSVEDVDIALYIDGSGSMIEEYRYRDDMPLEAGMTHDSHAPPVSQIETVGVDEPEPEPVKKKGFLAKIFGWFRDDANAQPTLASREVHKEEHEEEHGYEGPRGRSNEVEPQVRAMLQYLATKDRNGTLRVAYWACGDKGKSVERIGDLTSRDLASLRVSGPKEYGAGTHLTPALKDFVEYIDDQARKGAKKGCGVFVTDGNISDKAALMKFSRQLAARIERKELVPLHLVLVGVGSQVNEEQLEEIGHIEVPGAEHLWCHRVSEEMNQMAELVSGLVDSTMTVASGGAVYDANEKLVRRYDKRLPAVLEFTLPRGHKRFTVEIDGRRYTQALPDE